jgi:hypothetical protein
MEAENKNNTQQNNAEITHDVSPEKRIKYYHIKDSIFYQEPLTLRKDQKIFEAISGVGLKDLSDISKMTIAEIVNLLFKSNILTKIIRILLDPVPPVGHDSYLTDDDILDLTNDTIQEIISDFFMLNPALMKLLKTFAGSLGGITKTLI